MNRIDKSGRWICACPPPIPDIMEGSEKQCMVCGMKKRDINKINKIKMKRRQSRIEKKANRYTNPFKEKPTLLLRKPVACLVCDKRTCKNEKHLYIVRHHTIFDMVNGKVVEALSRKGIEEVNKLK